MYLDTVEENKDRVPSTKPAIDLSQTVVHRPPLCACIDTGFRQEVLKLGAVRLACDCRGGTLSIVNRMLRFEIIVKVSPKNKGKKGDFSHFLFVPPQAPSLLAGIRGDHALPIVKQGARFGRGAGNISTHELWSVPSLDIELSKVSYSTQG